MKLTGSRFKTNREVLLQHTVSLVQVMAGDVVEAKSIMVVQKDFDQFLEDGVH